MPCLRLQRGQPIPVATEARARYLREAFKHQLDKPKSCVPPSIQPLQSQADMSGQDQNEVPVDQGIRCHSLTQDWCQQQGALARCRACSRKAAWKFHLGSPFSALQRLQDKLSVRSPYFLRTTVFLPQACLIGRRDYLLPLPTRDRILEERHTGQKGLSQSTRGCHWP